MIPEMIHKMIADWFPETIPEAISEMTSETIPKMTGNDKKIIPQITSV